MRGLLPLTPTVVCLTVGRGAHAESDRNQEPRASGLHRQSQNLLFVSSFGVSEYHKYRAG